MRRALTAGVVPVMLASACAPAPPPAPAASAAPTTSVTSAPAALPAPQALTEILYRLADPAVPGADKLGLLEDSTASDAAVLDGFAAALRDGGFVPLTVSVTDVGWSDDRPGDVRATVAMAGPQQQTRPEPEPGDGFRFPMDFHPYRGGWQLSRETADLMLTATP